MSQFLLAVHGNDEQYAAVSPDDQQRMFAQVGKFNEDIMAAGIFVFAGGLESATTATVVETLEPAEEPLHLLLPGSGGRLRPVLPSFRQRQCPLQQVAELAAEVAGQRAEQGADQRGQERGGDNAYGNGPDAGMAPGPVRRIVGTLSQTQRVLDTLGLENGAA